MCLTMMSLQHENAMDQGLVHETSADPASPLSARRTAFSGAFRSAWLTPSVSPPSAKFGADHRNPARNCVPDTIVAMPSSQSGQLAKIVFSRIPSPTRAPSVQSAAFRVEATKPLDGRLPMRGMKRQLKWAATAKTGHLMTQNFMKGSGKGDIVRKAIPPGERQGHPCRARRNADLRFFRHPDRRWHRPGNFTQALPHGPAR